ncbi:MAG: hypothetical protein ACI8RD_008546, partial [Bacillariaceae sp.]
YRWFGRCIIIFWFDVHVRSLFYVSILTKKKLFNIGKIISYSNKNNKIKIHKIIDTLFRTLPPFFSSKIIISTKAAACKTILILIPFALYIYI